MTMIGMKIAMEEAKATQTRLNRIHDRMNRAIMKTTAQEAHLLRALIVKGIRKQAPGGQKFRPLADSTIEAKGSSKALIHHGDLIRSISVHKEFGGAVYFVGVHKEAVAPSGSGVPGDAANIAEVLESGTKNGRIKPLPYLRPSFNVWKKGVDKRVLIRIVADTGLGKPLVKGASKILMDTTKQGFQGNITSRFTSAGKLSWKIS